ncbi:MAG: molybdenum cofactor guanylyltransferase [Isosphaeraceae bacterium]
MKPAALVLCGGESRRMGRPKAWLRFGPELMLQRVVRLVATVADPIVVVAAPGQDLPEVAREVTILRDAVAGRGPLQGLATGLACLPDSTTLVYATATDVPFLEPRWITRLIEMSDDHDLVIPFVGGYYHPLAALYRKSAVLPAIEALLREDRLRPVFLAEAVKTRVVDEMELRAVDPDLGTLRNLNFPEDYEQALREAGLEGEGADLA